MLKIIKTMINPILWLGFFHDLTSIITFKTPNNSKNYNKKSEPSK